MDRIELARMVGAQFHVGEKQSAPVVVEETDQIVFMKKLADAMMRDGPVFLADPHWGEQERTQLSAWLNENVRSEAHLIPAVRVATARGWLCIPSGGSSGQLKFARHDEETISAAVRGFCAHFQMTRVNAIGLLPLHHVSGLMAWMRCALTGGNYLPAEWKAILSDERPVISATEDWVISLVPTQLQRLLELPAAVKWLGGFRVIFIGGGPIWDELVERAAAAGLRLSLSYGMTESAAMVAALRPTEFFGGARSVGKPLPHVQISLSPAGLIRIAGDSLFRGYWPEFKAVTEYETADLGHFDAEGNLVIIGRSDTLIISGGEKISPLEVEAALRATGRFTDVAVIGLPDDVWGQMVVACYPGSAEGIDVIEVGEKLEALANFKRPKKILAITPWPRNAQGKVNRAELLRLAQAKLL